MSSELVLKMRTCSAALLTVAGASEGAPKMMLSDAAYLLAEASNALDTPEDLGEPMEPIGVFKPAGGSGATWISGRPAELPAAVPRPCPACGNVAARKVRITHTKLLLTCPMCSHEWEYAP